MPRLSEAAQAALFPWWDLIYDGAQHGYLASDITSAVYDTVAESDGALEAPSVTAIATLYGYAARMTKASFALQGAEFDQAINADMIATAPYARSETEMSALPVYHVKFLYTYIDQNGVRNTGFRTSVFNYQLSATKAELFADIQSDALGMAAKYGHQLVDAIPIQILAI